MSSHNGGDWVRQGTPRDTDWADEQSEYGTTVSPAEWNDYTPEQSERVTPPASRARTEEDEPTTRVLLEDPHAAPAHALHEDEATMLQPIPASELDEPVTPARAAVLHADHEERHEEHAGESVVPEPTVSTTPVMEPESPAVAQPTSHEIVAHEPAAPEPVVSEPAPVADPAPAREAVVETESETTVTQEVPLFHDAPDAKDPADEETVVQRLVPEEPAATPVAESPAEVSDESVEQAAEQVVEEPTEPVRPRPIIPEQVQPANSVPEGVFREADAEPAAETPTEIIETPDAEPGTEPTTAMPVVPAEELDAERQLEEQLAAARAARNERLGVVESSGSEVRAPQTTPPRTTDRFLPSFGLLVLRVVVATILGLIGYQILTSPEATTERLATTLVPQPQLMAWVLGFTLAGIALFLVIGLMVRIVGLVMLVLSIATLALYRWGAFSPFMKGVEGFSGDRDLLLGTIGLLFIAIGGGAWGIDGAFRRARARAKAERTS